ncbi:MAG: hypothetical protein JW761_09260 [Prolixibacteraceae bacterium]|nr:hypothetical protein [Prolixibacteraceae bacterium]
MKDFETDTIERGICNFSQCGCAKLHVTDWLSDIKSTVPTQDIIEVRFKNTRKDYYVNVNNLKLQVGDLVAVEANPGHDIGIVSLMGELVNEQMKKHKVTLVNGELRKIYRKAKQVDIDKWKEAIAQEHQTMIRSRQITADLKLDMKIGDVEYQGDKTKAIFYYIADGRVDFRQLIKILAETFRIRIEMKQIGARQEAGRIGGIGPCGRELCCATWMSNFVSVTTNAARYQEISLNPQKLAGQCGKLKCCLNFEVDTYIDAQKDFPPNHIPLETEVGTYVFFKADIFNRKYWYTLRGNSPSPQVEIPVEMVKEIQQLNRKGKKPEKIIVGSTVNVKNELDTFHNVVGQEDLTRFDRPKSRSRKKKRHQKRTSNRKPDTQ